MKRLEEIGRDLEGLGEIGSDWKILVETKIDLEII